MEVKYGDGKTEYGPGVSIDLDGSEIATAINAYLVAHGVCISGPKIITVNGEFVQQGHVYVTPDREQRVNYSL